MEIKVSNEKRNCYVCQNVDFDKSKHSDKRILVGCSHPTRTSVVKPVRKKYMKQDLFKMSCSEFKGNETLI